MPSLQPTVLVVEDDGDLRDVVVRNLGGVGFLAHGVGSGRAALSSLRATPVDVVVLDLGLPDLSGTKVCSMIRAEHPGIPVLMLTARGELESRMAGFEAGADDYVVKPFALRELAARLNAVLRRTRGVAAEHGVLEVGTLRCSPDERRVWRGEQEVQLSRREFDLLALLMSEPGVALSRQTLLDRVWDEDLDPESNVVDQSVRRLRDKVDRPFGEESIETVRGIGYRIRRGDLA